MYQIAYNTNELKQKDIQKIFENILIKDGTKVLNDVNYGTENNLNITNYLKSLRYPFSLCLQSRTL